MWERVLQTIGHEFSDIPDAEQATRVALRLTVAVLLGAAIGYERERRDSAAGLRTHMLVALGAALFVLVPEQAGMPQADMSRVLQGVIAGVGFLGAGAVLKMSRNAEVRGLTTAAGIWATAAIGVTVGLGREATALMATVMVVLILSVLYRLERYITRDGDQPSKPEPETDDDA